METTIISWGSIGRMEKKMETTIFYKDYIGVYWVAAKELKLSYYDGV